MEQNYKPGQFTPQVYIPFCFKHFDVSCFITFCNVTNQWPHSERNVFGNAMCCMCRGCVLPWGEQANSRRDIWGHWKYHCSEISSFQQIKGSSQVWGKMFIPVVSDINLWYWNLPFKSDAKYDLFDFRHHAYFMAAKSTYLESFVLHLHQKTNYLNSFKWVVLRWECQHWIVTIVPQDCNHIIPPKFPKLVSSSWTWSMWQYHRSWLYY